MPATTANGHAISRHMRNPTFDLVQAAGFEPAFPRPTPPTDRPALVDRPASVIRCVSAVGARPRYFRRV